MNNTLGMNKKFLFVGFVVIALFAISCKKGADAVIGTYSGSVTYNASSLGPGTVIISKVGDNTVNINFTIGADSTILFNNTGVAGTEPPYSLSYSDPGGNLYGQVNGNSLIMTYYDTTSNQTQFSGSK